MVAIKEFLITIADDSAQLINRGKVMINKRQCKIFCKEDIKRIENFREAIEDGSQTWVCHHRLETHDKWGRKRDEAIPSALLIDLRLYCNRPADELIFMKKSDHQKLHQSLNSRRGKTLEEIYGNKKAAEIKAKSSFYSKGKPAWNKGLRLEYHPRKFEKYWNDYTKLFESIYKSNKKKVAWNKGIKAPQCGRPGVKRKSPSEETRKRISESQKGKFVSKETRERQSLAAKNRVSNRKGKPVAAILGTKWYNNGLINKHYVPGREPAGFVQGRLTCKSVM